VHPNFAPADVRTPQRSSAPFANVRVLNTRGAVRPSSTPASLPDVRRTAPAQADALPSTRFAHPRSGEERSLPAVEPIRRATPAETHQAPRPGVSYIAGPEPAQPQPAYRNERPANTLPQPPRFERAPMQPARAPEYTPPREYAQPSYQAPHYEQPHYESLRPAARPQQHHAEPAHKAPPPRKDER
jgi:hypothetical protein